MEDYKFVGFNTNLDLYLKVEDYIARMIENILADTIDPRSWSFVEYQGDTNVTRQEVRKRRFTVSPDTVIVGCYNAEKFKGVRIQAQDPAADGNGAELTKELGVSLAERPAIFTAFMDEFGEEGEPRFSRDLVIVLELTKRTESVSAELIKRYVVDGLSYGSMVTCAQQVSNQQQMLWDRWTLERKV